MYNTVKCSLDSIIDISRQLLSQLDYQKESINNGNNQHAIPVKTTVTDESSQFTDEHLSALVTERQVLIAQLFDIHTKEQLSTELQLINEMVSLDQQLISKAQLNKQELSKKVLTVRNSKKITKHYQKY